MKNLTLIKHSLIADSLLYLRDSNSTLQTFRHYSDKICKILLSEATRDVTVENVEVTTPITKTIASKLSNEIIVIPVLRAGLAMLAEAISILPDAKVGIVGLERNEETAVASEYYWKLPQITKESIVIITDPMLATGGSLLHLLRQIVPKKPKQIRVVCVIAAPEGVDAIEKEFPEVNIYTATLDEKLNSKKYIVPGLGDYGDRYFGTE